MHNVATWGVLLERFHQRLSLRKSRMLSIGRRLMLVKTVLGRLGIYYLSIFMMPIAICRQLERLRSRFFWGMEEKDRILHRVKWDVILNRKEHGGLVVGSLATVNQPLLCKWRWHFLAWRKSSLGPIDQELLWG